MKQQSDFLRISTLLWSPDDIVEIRPLPAGGSRRWVKAAELAGIMPELEKENANKINMYFGVLPRVANGGTATDCLPGMAVWADIDDGCTPRDAWKRAQTNGLPDPSIVINSGHGTHLYWTLSEKATPQQITGIVADIITVLDSDKSVKDAARIMRIPGFMNWKEPSAMAKLEYIGPARYSFEQLRSAIVMPVAEETGGTLPSLEDSNTERARRYIATIPGSGTGGRTATAYRVACVLCNDYKLDDYTALELLKGWDSAANNPPICGDRKYPANELEKIIGHARSYCKKPQGTKKDQPALEYGRSLEKKRESISIPTATAGNVMRLYDEIDLQEQGKRSSIPLPWHHLNLLSKPLRPGSVLLLAGPIKVGKSYLLINMAVDCHFRKVPWRYLPLEDDWNDFAFRVLACLESDYDMTDDSPEKAYKRRDALTRHGAELEKIMANVNENPRLGHKDAAGNSEIPPIYYDAVVTWAREAMKKNRILFIDPLSQIDARSKETWSEEAAFIRQLLAIAKDSGGTIVLSGHTNKRPGAAAKLEITAEDVQGSSMLTRLVHTVLMINGHEVKESEVRDSHGAKRIEQHNRTLYIAAARNGAGTRQRMAFTQRADGPVFVEHGLIQKESKQ